MRTRTLATLIASSLLAACGGVETSPSTTTTTSTSTGAGGDTTTTTSSTGGQGGSGGMPIPHVDLVWTPCPLYSDGTGPMAECATPELPLRRGEPEGKKIGYLVKRYAKPGSARSKQFWMLAGGPGSSGIIYEKRAELLAEDDDTIEVYIPDHRGTGDSTRLGCKDQEAESSAYGAYIAPGEWKKCFTAVEAEWGPDLTAFNVTNSANDLGILVEATRRPDAKVFVYGASYGTFWGHRYLQLFPHQADGVILDAIVPPVATLARQDIDCDEASADLFQACVDDPACGPKVGGDPRAFALALYDKLDQGHCSKIGVYGPPHTLLRRAFGQMMMTWNARRLIPAAMARADRCNTEDVSALKALFAYYFASNPANDLVFTEWGWVLSNYIVFSELWDPEATVAQMDAWREDAAVSRDVTSNFAAPLSVMTHYPHDEYYGGFADTDMPLLMLQGTWDPATRPVPAEALKNAYTGASQYWIEIPRGPHGALQSVPMADGKSCGTKLVLDFLANPKTKPDTSCLSNLAPFTFDGTPELNDLLFGTQDAWGGL